MKTWCTACDFRASRPRQILRSLLLLMGALGTALPGWSQPLRSHTTLQLSEYHKQVWQVEDGLPESNVRQIAQGPDGKLLLATFSGVVSFDGQRFNRVGVNGNDVNTVAVNAVLPDGHGGLWLGTDGAGVLHVGGGSTVNISDEAGLLHERIRTMTTDRTGALWVATHNGVERYVNGALRRVDGTGMIAGDITTVFAETDAGSATQPGMYFVTSQGLYLWTNGHLRPLKIPSEYGLPVAVYRDPQHRLWLGTNTQVLQVTDEHLHDDALAVHVVATTGTPVTTFAGDSQSNLWIGTRHSGLWRYQPDSKEGVSHWSSREGLDDETIRSLFIDDEDNLWIGMLSGGLSRWRKAAFAPYGQPEGFASSYAATAFADSRGDLWLGTWGQGLFRRRGGVTTSMPLPDMPVSTPIRAITEDRTGKVWIGTWFDGVYQYDGRRFQHFRLGIESPINAVSALLAHSDGGLWIGTYTGLQHFPSGLPDKGAAEHLLETKLITCLLQDVDGSVLVGTSEGLFRVRDKKILTIQGLPNPYVLSLTRDSEGTVWIGPRSGGLLALQGDKAARIAAASQLASYPVYRGVEDRDGHLWMGTSRGILRVGVTDLHAALGEEKKLKKSNLDIMIFGKADGMRSSDCSGPSQPNGTRMPDGSLWFATTQGFVHTTAYAEAVAPLTPKANIEGWTFSQDRAMPPISGNALVVEPGQSDVRIVFNARYLANPDRIEFRYRLKGYDSDWTSTRFRMAHYQHLSPGSYQFEVQARMGGAAWDSPTAVLSVRQNPHFYQAWYFYTSISALCILLGVVLYRRRVRQVRASMGLVMEERNRIARECHDTLMAGFSAVSWQIEATSKQLEAGTVTEAAVASCDLARSMLLHCQAEARRIIWDLRDSDEITGDLSMALRRAIDAHYRQSSVQVKYLVTGDECALPPSSVHHLVCIGQEAIANALRHAAPSLIQVHLQFQTAAVRMQIQDDGCGFQPSRSLTRQGHFGVVVMEERARKLGGDLTVQSQIGKGTIVTARIPFLSENDSSRTGQMSGNSIVRWIGI